MGLFEIIAQLVLGAAQNSSNDKVSNIATKIYDGGTKMVESAERDIRSKAKKLSNAQLEYAIEHTDNNYTAGILQEELDSRE